MAQFNPDIGKKTQFQSGDKQVEIARKGGSVKSLKKTLANQLKGLKKKGVTNGNLKELISVMENPECSSLQIKSFIDDWSKKIVNQEQAVKFANVMINWHKSHFGDKKKIEGGTVYNTQINIVKPKDV